MGAVRRPARDFPGRRGMQVGNMRERATPSARRNRRASRAGFHVSRVTPAVSSRRARRLNLYNTVETAVKWRAQTTFRSNASRKKKKLKKTCEDVLRVYHKSR